MSRFPFVSDRKGSRNVAELADPLLAYAFYLQSGEKNPNIIKINKWNTIKIKPQGFQWDKTQVIQSQLVALSEIPEIKE